MQILLTGSNGFIGNHLVKFLKNVIMDDSKPLVRVPAVDAVCHQAAITATYGTAWHEYLAHNVHYPAWLFPRLLDKGCKTFVIASSCSVYGNTVTPFVESAVLKPLNDYAKSKALLEEKALAFGQRHKVNVVILRYSNVYGTGEGHKKQFASVVYKLVSQMLNNKNPSLFKKGEQKRDWVSVFDVCQANALALNHKGIDIFNVGSGQALSFNQVVAVINEELGSFLSPQYIDMPEEFRDWYQVNTQCSLEKIKKILNFDVHFSFREGIRELIHAKKKDVLSVELKKAKGSKAYMVGIWCLEENEIKLFRSTSNFPFADMPTAIEMLKKDLEKELSTNNAGTA